MLVSTAKISDCGRFRWTLVRQWDRRDMLLVVMFNPSTADAAKNDPTITLLCHLASWNGFGGITVVNLCPLRSSTPDDASAVLRDRGASYEWRKAVQDNELVIRTETMRARGILVAWGALVERAYGYERVVLDAILQTRQGAKIYSLGLTLAGHPIHPMARGKMKVPKDRRFVEFTA